MSRRHDRNNVWAHSQTVFDCSPLVNMHSDGSSNPLGTNKIHLRCAAF